MQLWKELLASYFRYLLVMVLSPLLLRGIIGKDAMDRISEIGGGQIAAILIYGVIFIWTSREKFMWWRRLKLALFVPDTTPPQVVVDAASVPIYAIAPLLPSAPIEPQLIRKVTALAPK